MWIELKRNRYETLINLDTGNEISLVENQVIYTFHNIGKNEFETYQNNTEAQARYEEIKGLLGIKTKEIEKAEEYGNYRYICKKCNKFYVTTRKSDNEYCFLCK